MSNLTISVEMFFRHNYVKECLSSEPLEVSPHPTGFLCYFISFDKGHPCSYVLNSYLLHISHQWSYFVN